MATKLSNTTFSTTYKDDFADSDQYYRILFNSGRALQARELTQSQTIIQKGIERFGSNIFVEGAAVKGGDIQLTRYPSIKLDTTTYDLPSNLEWSDLEGYEFTGTSPAIKFKVRRAYDEAVRNDGIGNNPPTLIVEYTDTLAGTAGTSSIVVQDGATFTNSTLGLTLQAASSNSTGIASFVRVASGVFFVKGQFVYQTSQQLLIDKYIFSFSHDIGFEIIEDVVTSDDKDALFDNQGAVPNIAASGADRYRIQLKLRRSIDLTSTDNFVFLARFVDGKITQQITKVNGYNTIYDLMALRTKEESGNYTLNPIIAKFNDISGNDSNLDLEISSGIAYLDGYRLELPPDTIRLSKATDTQLENGQPISVSYGNYVIGSDSANKGLPNIETFASVDLRDSINYGSIGSTIGTARVRAIEEDDNSTTRYYFFDIQMNSGQNFRNTKSFGTSATDYVNIVLEDGIAVLKSTANNSLLFDLPKTRPTFTVSGGVSDVTMTVQKKFSIAYDGSQASGQIDVSGAGDLFTLPATWVVSGQDSAIDPNPTLTENVTAASYFVEPSTYPGSGTVNYEVAAYISLAASSISHRSKTLAAAQSITTAWPSAAESDGSGLTWIDLGYADVHEVQRLRTVDSDGEDLTANFTFDNGQRDNFYAKSRLIAKPGVSIPTGNIYTKFRRFTHGGGDYFSVNSYLNAIPYEDIPDFTKSNGEIVNLRDVLDFRPVQATDGTYTGTGGVINLLPQNTGTISADVEYYLPRKDKLVVQLQNLNSSAIKFGQYRVVQGTSSFSPQPPNTPTGSLSLYDLSLKPYTLNKNDVELSFIKNKNYTMKDIGQLEKRIDDVVELTTLSLLENETASITVLDSAGNPRTKAGFLADNFTNYAFSDTFNPSYRASIDQGSKELTPKFTENNVRILYDADNAANTVTKVGDYLLLPYTETPFIDNDLPTGILSVNASGYVSNVGNITLSPLSDIWFETEYVPDIVIDKGDITQTSGSVTVRSRNDSKYSWYGSNKVITGTEVVRELINEVILEKKFIPYMRSIKVYFKVRGLRPNTRHFAFFGGTLVSDWVRQETSFVNYSDTTADYGSSLTGATGHPDGSTNLVSNAQGEIIGSFVIPSTESLKFRCGDTVFKLLDISANDDDNSASSAYITFTSVGVLNISERTFESTRHVTLATVKYRGGYGDGSDPKPGSSGNHNYNGGFYSSDGTDGLSAGNYSADDWL